MDDQLGRVAYCGLGSADFQPDAHAILLLEALKSVHLRYRARADLLDDLLPVDFKFLEIDTRMSLAELLLKSLVHGLILERSLIETLLDACLADCPVSDIVKLGKKSIVDVLILVFPHEVVHDSDLSFVCHVLIHQLLTSLFVLDRVDELRVSHLLVELLDELIDRLPFRMGFSLQLLDVAEELPLGHLKLGPDQQLGLRVLNQL